jgi:hypothetical protein
MTEDEMEVDPQEFGEVVATVKILGNMITQIDSKLDTVIADLAVRRGVEDARRRYSHTITGFVSAIVAGIVTYMIDFSRH